MKKSLLQYTIFFITICVLNIECGIVQIGSSGTKQKADTIKPQMLSQWIGNYKGTVKISYGKSTKTIDSPAELTIGQYTDEIIFVLKPRFENRQWRINVKPSSFSLLSTVFSSHVNQMGRLYTCDISIKLEGENLSGIMKVFSSSVLTNSYTLEFTKTK